MFSQESLGFYAEVPSVVFGTKQVLAPLLFFLEKYSEWYRFGIF